MARRKFLEYIYENIIRTQEGYSFSIPHTLAYSIEAVQEANLATRFNPIFWNCACLSVNAGSASTSMTQDYEDVTEEDTIEDESTEEQEGATEKSKDGAPDYEKISKAIVQSQQAGIVVSPPSVNLAQMDFLPDVKSNSIVYSLRAVTNVNSELASQIISRRPYFSLEDFLRKVEATTVQVVSLIKAGAFDELYPNVSRGSIMERYLDICAEKKLPQKSKLTMADCNKLVKLNAIPANLSLSRRVMVYKKWVMANEVDKQNRRVCLITPATQKFFKEFFAEHLTLGKDYDIIPQGIAVKQTRFNKICDVLMAPMKAWLESENGLQTYTATVREAYKSILREKYCSGSEAKWEMQSVHYYSRKHELANINLFKYNIVNFDLLPENPVPISYKRKLGDLIPVYEVKTIAGTIIGVNNTRHTISLLTNFGNVVDVKFYAGQFVNLYRSVFTFNAEGKKEVVEKPWLSRGNLVLVTGMRRENAFIPKTNWDAGEKHSVRLITNIIGNELILKNKREEV